MIMTFPTTPLLTIFCAYSFVFLMQYCLQVKIKRTKKQAFRTTITYARFSGENYDMKHDQLQTHHPTKETIFFCCCCRVFYHTAIFVYLFFTLRMHKYCIPRAVSFSHYIEQHKKTAKVKKQSCIVWIV